MDSDELRKVVSKRTYSTYLDRSAATYLASKEDFFSCTAAECQFGGFITKGDGNIFRCQSCQTRSCIDCKVPFHENSTCEGFQSSVKLKEDRESQEERSLAKIKEISKPCPSCKTNFDKYTGCDHITCPICRTQWCWACSALYESDEGIHRVGNSAHQDDCAYHTNRLPVPAREVERHTPGLADLFRRWPRDLDQDLAIDFENPFAALYAD
ncbi:hypothetical protein LTR95_006558 [Oleoguttula sp. CCFEE 5521]